jgi:hypothetical protein
MNTNSLHRKVQTSECSLPTEVVSFVFSFLFEMFTHSLFILLHVKFNKIYKKHFNSVAISQVSRR